MTKAIQLAKECGATFYPDQAIDFGYRQLETFYARAQAQALREAADKWSGYARAVEMCVDLRRMAAELERK